MLRVLAALALVIAGAVALPALAQAQQAQQAQSQAVITLKDGTRLRFVRGMELNSDKPEAHELMGVFQFEDASFLNDHAKLIAVSDQLFGGIVMVAAEARGFKRAAVGFLISSQSAGGTTAELVEDFHYARGDDPIWLRQAGPEPWKTAQDPNDWTPPVPEIVDLGDYGKVEVVFAGEIGAPPGRKRAFGVEMYTPTAVRTGRKIEEMRAMWEWLDPDKLKGEGYDIAVIQNFEERARAKFHVRQGAFLVIATFPNGEWPTLPQGPLGPDGKPAVTAENIARSAFDLAIAALGGTTNTALPAPAAGGGIRVGTEPSSGATGSPVPLSRFKRASR